MADKPDLVLIHGWGMHATVWQALMPLLQPSFNLYLIDLPGHGSAIKQYLSADPAIVSQQLLAQAPTSAYWLGWSLGGLLAAQAAVLAPQRVKALVLLNSSPCFVSSVDWPCGVASALVDDLIEELAQDHRQAWRRFVTLQVVQGGGSRQTLRGLFELLQQRIPTAANLRTGIELLRHDLRLDLKHITCPTLLLGGQQDPLIPADAVTRYAKLLPHALGCVQPQWGHVPMLDDVVVLNHHISRFLLANQAEHALSA